jgi:hypothetical protein
MTITTLPRRPRPAVVGAVAVAVVAGGLLGGCSGSGSSVSCSGNDCRATVTGAPTEVDQPGGNQSSTRVKRSGTRRPPRNNDGVDFGVNVLGPGWADVEDDGTVTRITQGGTFVEDGSTVRLESSDGRTAVFTFRKR